MTRMPDTVEIEVPPVPIICETTSLLSLVWGAGEVGEMTRMPDRWRSKWLRGRGWREGARRATGGPDPATTLPARCRPVPRTRRCRRRSSGGDDERELGIQVHHAFVVLR